MSNLTNVLNVLKSHVAQPVSAAFAQIPAAGQAAIKIGGRVLGGFGALVAAYKLNAAYGVVRFPVKIVPATSVALPGIRCRNPLKFSKEAMTKMAKAQAIGATIGSFLIAGAGLFFACKKY